MRKMKKALAAALSAVMVMGTSMTAFASDQNVSVDAPIYAYDITNVIVPTNFSVAFNPSGLDVSKDGGTSTVQTQIVSKNYGIINKSTKNKVITVTLNVEDLNGDKITFTADPADVTNAAADDYVINLTVVPADASGVQVGATPAVADLTTTGADLANVTMTEATASAKALTAGENEVDFLLEKAAYSGTIDLDEATGNNVADEFTIQGLAASGNGITAFTFGGTMNAKADWTKLTKGIRITAVYSNENAPDGAAAVTGTGALYENPNPVFKTGKAVGTIKYKAGTGTDAVASITKIEMNFTDGNTYDIYNEFPDCWAEATCENDLIIFDSGFVSIFADGYPDDETREATVVYETVGGTTKTVTVNVRLREPVNVEPSFSTGSTAGTISYEIGGGNKALASISKIEMDFTDGNTYDVYHEFESSWVAATDADGVITLDAGAVSIFDSGYPSDATKEATITYETVGGETQTATVNIKLR